MDRCKWCDSILEVLGKFKACPHCDKACDDAFWNGVSLSVPMDNQCPKCYTVLRRHYR